MHLFSVSSLLSAALLPGIALGAIKYQCSNWRNVRTGASGGFSTGIIFNPNHKGLAYLRTDIGGVYRLNAWDHTWTALTDGVTGADWGNWGADGIATDPTEVSRFYALAGMYTNGWDPNNATIWRSKDFGASFEKTKLPFKAGGNMYGRGLGERIVVDPNKPSLLYLGARSGNGLWKSTDYAATWAKVNGFTTVGNWPVQTGPANPYGDPNVDIVGPTWIVFDADSGPKGAATPHIYIGVANDPGPTIFVSKDAGSTWSAVPNQPEQGFFPHKGKISPKEKVMYISYGKGPGPNDGSAGVVWRFNMTDGAWTEITPEKNAGFGYGGLSVDLQKPGTVMVAALNKWWPDTQIYRSLDGGATWKKTWDWAASGYPNLDFFYDLDISTAPWLIDYNDGQQFRKTVGHWVEVLEIDPYDSNHFLYVTGATVQGSRNLLNWDKPAKKFTLSSLSVGIEETAVLDLTSPQTGPPLVSVTGDIGGWVHESLDIAPKKVHKFQTMSVTDYAGNVPATLIRGHSGGLDISMNSGQNWTAILGSPGWGGGSAIVSANGKVVVWQAGGGTVRSEDGGTLATIASGLPSDAILSADKRNASLVYGGGGNFFYVSENAGLTFTQFGSALAGTVRDIAVNPYKAGDVWVSANNGVYHSTYPFANWTKSDDIAEAWSISVGKAKSADAYPSVYVVAYARPDGTQGVYRSDDGGKNWAKTNDNAKNGFASPGGDKLAADTRKWGRIYVGTNGRGIFYGDPSCPQPQF